MKRKTLLISIVVLTTVLMASSMIAVSQAWWPFHNPEYVGYDLRQVMGGGEIIYTDPSGAPKLIIIEATDTMSEGTLTIGDQVYTYPDDFDYNGIAHIELNAITGEADVRLEKTFTFKMHGKPTLKSWVVLRTTGYIPDPVTGVVDPENLHSEGVFKLTGTGRFALVEGFGLEKDTHHFGFVKGWPLK
jgi:hypothetical protein